MIQRTDSELLDTEPIAMLEDIQVWANRSR